MRNFLKSASLLTDCFVRNKTVSNFGKALERSKRSSLPRETFTENPQNYSQGNDLLQAAVCDLCVCVTISGTGGRYS